jgi:hypothetical protein
MRRRMVGEQALTIEALVALLAVAHALGGTER